MSEAAARSIADAVLSSSHSSLTRVRPFEERFREEFAPLFASLFRYLDRLSGDPALAADIAQETLLRLYRRGSMPDDTRAWLAAVAHNLLRNQRRQAKRRQWLLAARPATSVLADPAPPPDSALEAIERGDRVRSALNSLALRDRQLLLLRYEGYSYRELAAALNLAEASVGTLLARAKEAFRRALEDDGCASE